MSFIDKAKAMISKNPTKIAEGIDKATDMIDEKTGGKYSDKLDKLDETVSDKLGGGNDIADGAPDATNPPA